MLRVMFVLVAAAAAWAVWNGVLFSIDATKAHRAETAWLIFAALLIASGLVRRQYAATPYRPPIWYRWPALLCIGASLVLYSSILGIGLLSDDFVLLHQARDGDLIDRSWTFVRPLPLAIWAMLDRLGPASAPFSLHVLNVALHGLNAWLVFVIALRFDLSRNVAAVAAALFLAWPFNVEAVTWASGIFDVGMTACVLAAAALTIETAAASRFRIAMVAVLAIGAVLSKETGVALPLLLVLLAGFSRVERRTRMRPFVIAAAVVVAAYLAARFTLVPPRSGYPAVVVMKHELLTRPFAALGLGIHRDLLNRLTWIPAALALAWSALFVRAARAWDAGVFRITITAAMWVLLSVAPLWTLFFVTDTLEGSRYLYLGSSLWAIAVAALIANATVFNRATFAAAGAVVALCVGVTLLHQRPWREAAAVRDAVVAGWAAVPQDCDPGRASDVPDSIRGAYVFRNGFAEAVADEGRHYSESCQTRWSGRAFSVAR
jgi:hypothetical protein